MKKKQLTKRKDEEDCGRRVRLVYNLKKRKNQNFLLLEKLNLMKKVKIP